MGKAVVFPDMRKDIGCICFDPEDRGFFRSFFASFPHYAPVFLRFDPNQAIDGNFPFYMAHCTKALQLYKEIPLLSDLVTGPILVMVEDVRFRFAALERNKHLWYAGMDADDALIQNRINALARGSQDALEREAVYLTPREQEVCQLLMAGFTSKEIADHLDISPGTVNAHKKQLFAKFKVHSVTQMVSSSGTVLYHVC